MAYRRRQGITRASTFQEKILPHPPLHHHDEDDHNPSRPRDVHIHSHSFSPSSSSSPSAAAYAVKPTPPHLHSPLERDSSFRSSFNNDPSKETYAMRNSSDEAEESSNFWSVLAKKAKSLIDDEPLQNTEQIINNSSNTFEYFPPYQGSKSPRKVDNPALRKKFDALAYSLNHIGDQIGNAFEEGRTIVENKTAGIIQETKKLQIRRQPTNLGDENTHVNGMLNPWKTSKKSTQQHMVYSHEDRLKASRDVALATAAKAKVLLRELKTVKADLAFAKERCSQLEDENKVLRDACEKGSNPEDDDMIRLQMETLLAEKARLAHENSVYARENRFLKEIVEYHQLTMQDVVYLDEGIEEVTEVYPIHGVSGVLSSSPPSPSSPSLSLSRSASLNKVNKSFFSHIAQDDCKDYKQNKTPRRSKSTPPTEFSNRC